jgi:hypothetical protein
MPATTTTTSICLDTSSTHRLAARSTRSARQNAAAEASASQNTDAGPAPITAASRIGTDVARACAGRESCPTHSWLPPRSLEDASPADNAPLALGTQESHSLERVTHLGEHGADIRADKLDANDDEERDQARDECIFDRRHAGFIAEKDFNSCHRIFLAFEWSAVGLVVDFTIRPTGLRRRLPPR